MSSYQDPSLVSYNPATGDSVYSTTSASKSTIDELYKESKKALHAWSSLPLEERKEYLKLLQDALSKKKEHLAKVVALETGKPLWDAKNEIESSIQKIPLTFQSFEERCQERVSTQSYRKFKPHGVAVVFGPYNFPVHLPNGHLVPALIAGNTVILKPSEQTPYSGEEYFRLFEEAGFPKGVVGLAQGGVDVGKMLVQDERLDALFFTGSANTGLQLTAQLARTPGKMLALEMGGNNPLVIGTVQDMDAVVYQILVSAYMTTGQRCTCARRLIVINNDPLIEKLIKKIPSLKIGSYDEKPEPFMGPLISEKAAVQVIKAQEELIALGAKPLFKSELLKKGTGFISCGLIDVTGVENVPDQEIFGPFLQVIRVKSIQEAIEEANTTKYGLISSILTDRHEEFEEFYAKVKTGLINHNMPTTGALSSNPFGGIGISGNHRPSAYFAVDYCSYPIAGVQSEVIEIPKNPPPGIG